MKSNMREAQAVASDCLELMRVIYKDACIKCSAQVSDLRDLKTIRLRVKREGVSFLTITLPSFAKDLERALADGFVSPALFRSFEKSGAIPVFLRGMLEKLFDHESGRILDYEPDHSTIVESARQICLAFKKVEMPCAPIRVRAAIESYVQVELANGAFTLDHGDRSYFERVSNCLWTSVLADLQLDSLIPRHGPGATAESIMGNQKWVWREWYERLEPYFGFFGSATSVVAYDEPQVVEKVTFVSSDRERPVRVVTVPKTLKAPRIIAIEPVCMQYAQQAIQKGLYALLESHPLTAGHVNFTNQSINQHLARRSSIDGRYATIDLSDASDRVPLDLALQMFDGHPVLRDAIDACRSKNAQLPDGRVIGPLVKFASMGSALCFPVEAMYFYTICVVALLRRRNLPVNRDTIHMVSRLIFVYGDDIIVPTDDAETVLDHLRKYNCKVNESKTFKTGKFRESCGTDAYGGYEVTPTYVRSLRPKDRLQAADIISWIATAHLFYLKGYWRTAAHMYCTCEQLLGELPYVSKESPALGRITFLNYRTAERWNDSYQRLETRGWLKRPVYRSDGVDGYPALWKCLNRLELRHLPLHLHEEETSRLWQSDWRNADSPVDHKHLERSARRGAVTLKLRWVPVT